MLYTYIDPENVYQPSASSCWKELFLFFCTSVAGKTASVQAWKIGKFFETVSYHPFGFIKDLIKNDTLRSSMETVGLGQYTRLVKVWTKIVETYEDGNEAANAKVEDLEEVVGMKTARFFLLNVQTNINCAVLDVHLLRHLREDLGYVDAPLQTPSSKKQYHHWEKVLVDVVAASGKSIQEYDIEVWKSKRNNV